jgi:hypothetical protein
MCCSSAHPARNMAASCAAFEQKKLRKKSLLNPPPIEVVYFTPQTIKPSTLPSELFKTGQITPQAVFEQRVPKLELL